MKNNHVISVRYSMVIGSTIECSCGWSKFVGHMTCGFSGVVRREHLDKVEDLSNLESLEGKVIDYFDYNEGGDLVLITSDGLGITMEYGTGLTSPIVKLHKNADGEWYLPTYGFETKH